MLQSTYDTETVRLAVADATAEPTTRSDIWNMSKPGAPLHTAQIRPGVFGVTRTKRALARLVRRRLAKSLGRISPRFLDDSHSLKCHCGAIAIEWDGQTLCENGHQDIEIAEAV